MSRSLPSVTVVIPAYKADKVIERALASVRDQDYPNVKDVVVASGDQATSEAAKGLGAVVVDNPSTRTPDALNLGFNQAMGDVVVRCDAQSVLPPTYISRAVETMGRTGATNVGGMQIPVGETFWEKAIAAAMSSQLGAGDARHRTGGEEGPVETVYLGVFNREAIKALGGFDPAFTRTQDYELNHRITESGGIVWFDPELKVEYRPRGSLRDLWSQYFQYGKAKRQFARRHPGSLRWRQLAPPSLVIALAISLGTSLWNSWALLVPGGYIVVLAAGTLFDRRANAGTVPALITMHLAWGLGFLIGVTEPASVSK